MALELLQTRTAHERVDCLAFSPDGSLLATGGFDPGNVGNTVKLWDVRTWAVRLRLRGLRGGVAAVAFGRTAGRSPPAAGTMRW